MDSSPKKYTLLIIDDNIQNTDIAVQHLRAYSFRILTASNGEDGLKRAQLARPDLILLDIRMPDIDGIETCRRLKANPETADIPIIFMTALSDTADKVRGLELGAVDYITKPIEAAELVARVQTHITLRDLQLRLETRVQERTLALEEKVKQYEKAQAEIEQLLSLLRVQSEQLRQVSQQSMAEQEQRYGERRDQLASKLAILETNLSQLSDTLAKPERVEDPMATAQFHTQHARALLADIQSLNREGSEDSFNGSTSAEGVQNSPLFKLSTREYEVFQLIAQGKSNAEMADMLVVSGPTVRTYRHRIMKKLGVADSAALTKFAIEHQIAS